jgi:hypothetical protein
MTKARLEACDWEDAYTNAQKHITNTFVFATSSYTNSFPEGDDQYEALSAKAKALQESAFADSDAAGELNKERDAYFRPWLWFGWFALTSAVLLLIASWLAKNKIKILGNRWFFAAASMAILFVGTLAYIAINAKRPVSISDPLFLTFGLLGSVYGLIYMLPTIIGLHKQNALAIFILNVLLGWTGIGWVAALIWSVLKTRPTMPENL